MLSGKRKDFFSSLIYLRENVEICWSQLHRHLTFYIIGFRCIGSMRCTASTCISCSFYCLLLEENNKERSMDEKQQTASSFYLLIDSILIKFLIRCQRILLIIIRNSTLKKSKSSLFCCSPSDQILLSWNMCIAHCSTKRNMNFCISI